MCIRDRCNPTGFSEVLFDLQADPLETKNILSENKDKVNELKKALEAHWKKENTRGPTENPTQKLDENLIEEIRNLGY